jgi:RNA 3'-terminal phosphate cyclase (ATP)
MTTREMVSIDGSQGEGGGQILRSALALSLVTGRPFGITAIRAGRAKPGLLRQHLTAVGAAREISRAHVEGAEIGSRELRFRPGSVGPGEYRFAVGTAGSATLVLQTVLPALALSSGPSHLTLEGGTHNPFAPPFDFLERAFLPLLERMGAKVTAKLERHGFYPAGGGCFTVDITPASTLRPLAIEQRGEVRRVSACAIVANLPETIGLREVSALRPILGLAPDATEVKAVRNSPGPGNALIVTIVAEHVTEVFTGFGEKRVTSAEVAARVGAAAKAYLEAGVPVGEHLADQLLLPMALAGGGSFRTTAPTEHTRTNAAVIRSFLDVDVRMQQESDTAWRIDVGRASSLDSRG